MRVEVRERLKSQAHFSRSPEPWIRRTCTCTPALDAKHNLRAAEREDIIIIGFLAFWFLVFGLAVVVLVLVLSQTGGTARALLL